MLNTSSADVVGFDILEKIVAYDAFRQQLESNPVEALANVGVSVQGSDLPQQIVLPAASSMSSLKATETEGFQYKWLGFIG